MQAAPAPAAALPAKLSLDYKEHVLLKELSSSTDCKFTLQPSQNKLTNINFVYTWFANITKMLDKFPDVEQLLFGTAATLNEGKNLTLKTTTCKTEAGVKAETAIGEKLHQNTSIQHKLDAFQQDITTFQLFVAFLDKSKFETEINIVAPKLFQPSIAPTKLLQGTKLFMSPQYQENVVLGDTLAGKTHVTADTDFVFPSSIRIGTAKHVTFHYIRGHQLQESCLHQLLRPHPWRWICVALSDGPFTHLLKNTWEGDHTTANLFLKLQEIQNAQSEETDQVFTIFNSIYMIHNHGMGYDKLMTKTNRENVGYVPIELHRRIELDIESENRTQAYDDFTTQNANVFTPTTDQPRSIRGVRKANAATGRTPSIPQ